MSKDLFKQAIAEAKSVREAAIANAKEAGACENELKQVAGID